MANIAPDLNVRSSTMLLLCTLDKLGRVRMEQRHTKSHEIGQMFKNEMRDCCPRTAHTQLGGLLFLL
jgi:hypothetical protein